MIRNRRSSAISRVLLTCSVLLLSACSPVYVFRASLEEAQILLARRDLTEIIKDPATKPELADKLSLVLEAREFASTLGLEPDGSFSAYSEVNRPVLVWVLSASSKTALEPHTWWFPIVGSVPYKGFFSKEEALAASDKLEKNGWDTLIRGSIAYSTLGWFDDPLLSTMVALDDVTLVDTVFHELTHSTIWLSGHAAFNESLANFVGAHATIQFFEKHKPQLLTEAQEQWQDQLKLAAFINEAAKRLTLFYDEAKTRYAKPQELLFQRRKLLWLLTQEWFALPFATGRKKNRLNRQPVNNALIVAYRIYLQELPCFERMYIANNRSLPAFIEQIRELTTRVTRNKRDPFKELCEINEKNHEIFR